MKKIVLLAVAIIVTVALIGPKIVGQQFQQGIEQTVFAINQNPTYTATIKSIESNWFSTHAMINLRVNMLALTQSDTMATNASIDIAVSAEHGPVIINEGIALSWLHTDIHTLNNALPAVLSIDNNAPIYHLVAHTNLLGNTTYTDQIAAMEYLDRESNTTILFEGMQGQGAFNSSSFTSNNSASSLSVKMADVMHVDIVNIAFNIKADSSLLDIMSKGFYRSDSTISVGSINTVNLVENTVTDLQSMLISITSAFDDEPHLAKFTIATSIADFKNHSVNLSDLLLAIELKQIEIAFLEAYQAFTIETTNSNRNQAEVLIATNAFFENNLLSALQAEPEYNVSALSGKINGSHFSGKAMLKLKDVSMLPVAIEDPSFWLQHTHVDSHLSMQKGAAEYIASQIIAAQMAANPNFASMSTEDQNASLAQQVEPTIAALVQQGMLVVTPDGYEVIFTMQNRSAKLNNMPVPL